MKMTTQSIIYADETCDYFNIFYKSDSPNIFAEPIIGLTTVATIDYLLLKKVVALYTLWTNSVVGRPLNLVAGNH